MRQIKVRLVAYWVALCVIASVLTHWHTTLDYKIHGLELSYRQSQWDVLMRTPRDVPTSLVYQAWDSMRGISVLRWEIDGVTYQYDGSNLQVIPK